MTLYLFKHTNYYNRIIKRFETIEEYPEPLDVVERINFIPNDGITTEQVLNYTSDQMPDYLVVCDDQENIVSRWFVIESVRLRTGQFKLELYRDVISDWQEEVINAPVFIEKAMAQIGDTAIFNNEDMLFNQIKTKETLLKDATRCPWIVGYVDRKWAGTDEPISIPTRSIVANYELDSLEDYEYYEWSTDTYFGAVQDLRFRLNSYSGSTGWVYAWDNTGSFAAPLQGSVETGVIDNYKYRRENGFGFANIAAGQDDVRLPSVYEQIASFNWKINAAAYTDKAHTTAEVATLLKEDGKIIQVGTNYYKIRVDDKGPAYNTVTIQRNGSALDLLMTNAAGVLSSEGFIDTTVVKNEPYQLDLKTSSYKLRFVEVIIGTAEVDIPQDRASLIDAPYDMFCMPFSDTFEVTDDEDPNVNRNTLSKAYTFKLAQELISRLGTNLYDIQLLPYCPLPDNIVVSSLGDSVLVDIRDYDVDYLIEQVSIGVDLTANQKRAAIIWCNESSFSKTLLNYIKVPTNNIDFKVANECDMYRLVSPNYSGGFEFSATKNNGVTGFRVDCTYKPINPYIRVAPNFDGLYGNIRDDARGLICGGDFSLTQWTDTWKQYEINNKNYSNSFDRQIENIEVNNSVQRTMEKWNVTTGTLGGVASGALLGGVTGNPYGAAAGAVVGGVASLAGGLADIQLNERLRTEALDYTKDQFAYNLQNIRALPNSLTKISAFNVNNKLFPILEYYTCTDIEKEALRNKITYNGMTIMRISTMSNFISIEPSYIKGRLIRLESLSDDFHIVNTIANELNKGVFI